MLQGREIDDRVSPHLDDKKAAQKEDSWTKFLQAVSDISIEQRSSYLLSLQHMAFDGQGNNCFQAALSHPAEFGTKQPYKLVPQTSK